MTPVRLFHFSDDPGIARFEPRPVRVAVDRPCGREWLDGPLVWAIDAAHALLYLFPRECPRIVAWATAETTLEDRALWLSDSPARAVAYIERAWLPRLRAGAVHRYALPHAPFEPVGEIGMWVSRAPVIPQAVETISDLPAALRAAGIELRVLDHLTPLRGLWDTTLHVSGLRLRNAQGWGEPGWPHSKTDRFVQA